MKAIERFRHQIEIVDLIGNNDPTEIQKVTLECIQKNALRYSAPPLIVQVRRTLVKPKLTSYNVNILPEYRIGLDPFTSRVGIEVKTKSDRVRPAFS